jgi:arginyl-tRNA synthetase
MNTLSQIKKCVIEAITKHFSLDAKTTSKIDLSLNTDKKSSFGDLCCNAALIIAPLQKQNPRTIADELKRVITEHEKLSLLIEKIEIAGPGFLNFFLKSKSWESIADELISQKESFFKPDIDPKKYLIEFVSANPTGPLHLGHGRGGIIGDVLSRVLSFNGHTVSKEFYINDAGNQISMLGQSLKSRCEQVLGKKSDIPEGGYVGQYLVDLAAKCIAQHGQSVIEKDNEFFTKYASDELLALIKNDLKNYNIEFDEWFSEKTLHEDGSIDKALKILTDKKLAYEQEGALWFRATEFGDDKDRVIRKADGSLTYIAADIAYHKNKFDRGFDIAIDILGQDHHGYVKRLKATMDAIGYDSDKLDVILYQLVSIKKGTEALRMSKRAGNFITLNEVIKTVGCDIARFFYLNRKAESHLEFDLDAALKKTEENPAFYVQYAYVRTKSVLEKANEDKTIAAFSQVIQPREIKKSAGQWSSDDKAIIKKMLSLTSILKAIENTYQTHLLAYFAFELAQSFHNYYATNRIINSDNPTLTKQRLLVVMLMRQTLGFCLDLLGISKPEKM